MKTRIIVHRLLIKVWEKIEWLRKFHLNVASLRLHFWALTERKAVREMRMPAAGPVRLVKKAGLQSTQLFARTQGPMVRIRSLLRKLQAILTGAGRWRPAVPANFPGMNVNHTKGNRFHQKIKKKASIAKGPEYRCHLGKTLSPQVMLTGLWMVSLGDAGQQSGHCYSFLPNS